MSGGVFQLVSWILGVQYLNLLETTLREPNGFDGKSYGLNRLQDKSNYPCL